MRILWFPLARADLSHLRAYTEADDPEAAGVVVGRILASVESLLSFPGRGRPGRVFGTGEMVVPRTPHLVAYRIRGETVEIHRVLHGAQEWPRRRW